MVAFVDCKTKNNFNLLTTRLHNLYLPIGIFAIIDKYCQVNFINLMLSNEKK